MLSKRMEEGREHIYYNVRISNIYDDTEEPQEATTNLKVSEILPKQSNYEMAITFWRIQGQLPIFICPIKEGLVNVDTITGITNANPGVITTAGAHGLAAGDYVTISGVTGMTQVNGVYYVYSVPAVNQLTLIESGATTPLNTTGYGVYIAGGLIRATSNNIDLTNFGVCYNYGGNDYFAPVIYASDSAAGAVQTPKSPRKNNGIQDVTTGYYNVYTFYHFIDLVNTALNTAWTAFNAAHPGVHASPIFFQYDATTGLISLVAAYSYSQPGAATVYMNRLLQNYFEALRYEYHGIDQTNFKDVSFIFYDQPGNGNGYAIPPLAVTNPPAYLIYKQEYDARYFWFNISTILFTSSTIHVRNENIPSILNPNATNPAFVQGNTFNPNFGSILSYYDIFYSPGGVAVREPIYYNPQIYKWVDLVSQSVLNQMNVNIYVQLLNGLIIPLFIPPNQSIDIKFLFRKK